MTGRSISRLASRLRGWWSVRALVVLSVIVLGWCALWSDVTAANLASGIVVGVLVVSTVGHPAAGRAVGIVPLVRLGAIVAKDLVISTFVVAQEILTPTDRTDEAIIAVDTPAARSHLLLLVVAITVTPGTAVVDADPDTGRLFLHVLHHDKAPDVIAHVRTITDLACAALPVDGPRPATSTASTSGVARSSR